MQFFPFPGIHKFYCSANKLCRAAGCFTTLVLFICFISICSIGIDSGGGVGGGSNSIVIIIIVIAVAVVVVIGIVTFFLCAVCMRAACCVARAHLVGHIQYYTFTVHVRSMVFFSVGTQAHTSCSWQTTMGIYSLECESLPALLSRYLSIACYFNIPQYFFVMYFVALDNISCWNIFLSCSATQFRILFGVMAMAIVMVFIAAVSQMHTISGHSLT